MLNPNISCLEINVDPGELASEKVYLPCLTLKVPYQISTPPPPPPPPTAASSPIVQEPKEAKWKAANAALNHPLRILIMNCQSIKNKKAELHTIID